MTFLNSIRKQIIAILLALNGVLLRHNGYALRKLEMLYKKFNHEDKASLKDSLYANWQIIKINVLTAEFLLFGFGIFGTLAATGAFNTGNDQMEMPVYLFWYICMIITISSGTFFWVLIGSFHIMYKLSYWVIIPIFVILTSLTIVYLIRQFWPFATTFPQRPFWEDFLIGLFLCTLATALIIYSSFDKTNFLLYRQRHKKNALLLVVPVEKRCHILSVSAQDHYVLISTKKGKHLHRLGLSEAIEMLPKDSGIKVHRSHWVSNRAIRRINKIGNRSYVVLSNDEEIPLSASKVKEVTALVNLH